MKLQIFFFILIFATGLCYSETAVVGNGGNILVCSESEKFNLSVVDLYELENSFQYDSNNSLTSKTSEEDIVFYILNKLASLKIKEANELKRYWNNFDKESKHVGFNFFLSGDLSIYSLPKDCILKTIIFQRDNYPYYVIHSDWNKLSVLNRAALTMHELLYRFKLENVYFNNLSSDSVRRLNAFLFSKQFNEQKNSELVNKLFNTLLVND